MSWVTIAYYVLTRKEKYKELGADYFEKRQEDVIVKYGSQARKSRLYRHLVYPTSLLTPRSYHPSGTVFLKNEKLRLIQ